MLMYRHAHHKNDNILHSWQNDVTTKLKTNSKTVAPGHEEEKHAHVRSLLFSRIDVLFRIQHFTLLVQNLTAAPAKWPVSTTRHLLYNKLSYWLFATGSDGRHHAMTQCQWYLSHRMIEHFLFHSLYSLNEKWHHLVETKRTDIS